MGNMESIKGLFDNLVSRRVAVIGDLYAEEFIHGTDLAHAQEAPVPVLTARTRMLLPGGAGHVAVLLRNLGLQVAVFGYVGGDGNGDELLRTLKTRHISTAGIVQIPERSTACRTRVSVSGAHYPKQDLLHVMTPKPDPVDRSVVENLLNVLASHLPQQDAVVLLDRDGVVLDPHVMQFIRDCCREHAILVIGDSEQRSQILAKLSAVVMNEDQAKRFSGFDNADALEMGVRLRQDLDCDALFLTRGAQGISVYDKLGAATHVATQAQSVFDVIGAGETVLSAVAAGLVGGWSAVETAHFANLAASVAVSRPGLAEISMQDILDARRRQTLEIDAEKLVTLAQLQNITVRAKSEGKIVVWTNGVYDIMHVGHILYLEKARSLGDILIVGLNSDASVRRIKGPLRPIVEENQRAKLLTALTCVDYVIIFDDQSPVHLIEALRPDVYAKGGDYTIDTINQTERRAVEKYGGRIHLMPGLEGMSTTNIIEKILQAYRE